MSTSTKMGSDWCPVCFTFLDAARHIESKDKYIPKPEDISVCIKCGSLLEFSNDMALREFAPAKFIKLPIKQRLYLLAMQANIIKLIEERINGTT